MIPRTPDFFDSEVMALIEDLGLVQIGSPEYREHLAMLAVQGVATFEHECELDVQRDLHYICKGLRPRNYYFRRKQDELFAGVQGKLF